MTVRDKRFLAIFLSVAMILGVNTFAFAEEITENTMIDSFEVYEDVYELNGGEVSLTSSANDLTTPTNAVSADKALSENLVAISENLVAEARTIVSGNDATYVVVYPQAIAFNGEKVGKKNPVSVKVYSTTKTVSSDDIVALSDNAIATKAGWTELTVKKVTFKAAKGATVKMDGSATVEIKKGTYIKSIKLDNKDANKAFNAATKDTFKTVKKSTAKVSGNGLVDGKDTVPFAIAVYPAYAGNDEIAINKAKEAGLKTVTLDFSKTKYKNGVPKKISGTIDSKKVTLKPTKKPGKYKGYGEKKECTEDTNSLKAKTYVEADGNFCGNIYYTAG